MVFHNIIDFDDVCCNGRSQHATFVEARVWYARKIRMIYWGLKNR